LVGLGYSDANWTIANSFEVIDLKSEYSTCPSQGSFPIQIAGSVSGMNYDNEPIICGGEDPDSVSNAYCRRFTNGAWKASPLLLTRNRSYGSSYFSPESLDNGRVFHAGGTNDQVQLLFRISMVKI